MFCQKEVEVTSVNWETKDAAAVASQVLASYRWHGIMYDINLLTAITLTLVFQMLGPKKSYCSLAGVHGGMVSN